MTSNSGPEDAGVERAEEEGGYGSPTPEQEIGGQESGGSAGTPREEADDEDQGEHDVD